MDTQKECKDYIVNSYARKDVEISHGKNATAYDIDGKKYIDFTSGIGVNSLGYCDSEWHYEVCMQAKTLQHTSNIFVTAPMVNLAKTLCEATNYSKVCFGNSGAEANECAIKTARKYSFDKYGKEKNRNKILTLKNSFHGRTITTLSATGQDVFHNYFFPFTEGFDFAPADDINAVKSMLNDEFCAVIVEFIQGEGGVIPLEHDFVTELFAFCNEHDILIIADEVQTGIGRTGKLLASQHFNVMPNITTIAKGIGNGLPIGMALMDEKTCDVLKQGDHGSTFAGNPVVCAGANVVLKKVLAEGFLQEVTKKGDYICSKLLNMDEVKSLDGMGLMIGITFKNKVSAEIQNLCIESGLLTLTAKQKLRLLPPLTISMEEIDEGLAILQKVLDN